MVHVGAIPCSIDGLAHKRNYSPETGHLIPKRLLRLAVIVAHCDR
jgi:hypothetical protein